MRCSTCHYSLQGLTEHRCPECGTPFDPNDPRTYERFRRPTLAQAVLVFICMFIGLSLVGIWSTRGGEGFDSTADRLLYLLRLVSALSFITAALAWSGWYVRWWWDQNRE